MAIICDSSIASLQIMPVQLPTAALTTHPAQDLTAVAGAESNPAALVLYPGEPSEILVRVENKSTRPLHFKPIVDGDFPLVDGDSPPEEKWCRVGTEGQVIPPEGTQEAVFYFQVPPTFFEDPSAVRAGKNDCLNLTYSAYIGALVSLESGPKQSLGAEFEFYIRPRSLYLSFLPALYREVDFIGRLLAIFERAFEPVVQSFEAMWAHLDPLTASEALLPFLAHWVAWPLDSGRSLQEQRRLLRRAVELYRWRGTRRGLRLYLHLYTGLPLDEDLPNEDDKHISITEPFGRSFVLNRTDWSESNVLGGGRAFHFVVRLRSSKGAAASRLEERLIRTIIEQEKPAYCTYDLRIETASP